MRVVEVFCPEIFGGKLELNFVSLFAQSRLTLLI